MGKLITLAGISNDEFDLILPEYLNQFPSHLQKQAENALRAFQGKNFRRAARLCEELLTEVDIPDIKVMRGQCYFSEENWEKALLLFEDLAAKDPENLDYSLHLGMVYHAMGDNERASMALQRLYPLKEYCPFYHTAFGDSLMKLGKNERAREVFLQEVKHYEQTGEIPSALMIDGAYQNLMLLDLEIGNGCFARDMESYCKFLDVIPMDSQIQDHLSGTVYLLSNYLSTKAFRPQFKRFIEHIHEKNYLTEQPYQKVLESGFVALEAQSIHDDRKISAMLEAFMAFSLDAQKERWYGSDISDSPTKLKAIVYEWYLCRYAPEHPAEIEYIHNTYPYSYRIIEDFLKELHRDARQAAEKRLKLLEPYYNGKSLNDIRSSMEEAYQRALRDQKEPSFVYDGGETYKRIQPKVGRNDPCPCGSGKKYKKCCGR